MLRDDPSGNAWQGDDDALTIEEERDMPGAGNWIIDADGLLVERSQTLETMERASAAEKKVRNDAWRAKQEKQRGMSEAEREENAKEEEANSATLLGRRVGEQEWKPFRSITAAAQALGLEAPAISAVARGRRADTDGYEFKYADKSGKQGGKCDAAVLISLTHIKTQWMKKTKTGETSGEAGGEALMTGGEGSKQVVEVEDDDIDILDQVVKTVDTAQYHWQRLRRRIRVMMMLRCADSMPRLAIFPLSKGLGAGGCSAFPFHGASRQWTVMLRSNPGLPRFLYGILLRRALRSVASPCRHLERGVCRQGREERR